MSPRSKKKSEEPTEITGSGDENEASSEIVPAQPEDQADVAVSPAPPTDFAMSLTEFGQCRNIRTSLLAGLKAFLRGDVRPRKLSAWDRVLERYLNS